jgi:hypothetical protein
MPEAGPPDDTDVRNRAATNALRHLPERVFAAAFRTDEGAYRVALAIFVTTAVAWTALQIAISPVDLAASPHDIPGHLDGGWRIVNGQVPHNDFYSPLGPAVPYLVGLGMAVSGPNIYAVVFPVLGAGLVVGAAAWMTSRSRFAPPLAVLVSLTVFATAVGLSPLGWGPSETDYAMFYNRLGYAVLMVLAVGCFLRRKISAGKPVAGTTAFCAGAGLACLLSLKINYFFVAIPVLVFAPMFLGSPRRWYPWTALGFVTLALLLWLVLRVHPAAYLRDMGMVYRVARDSQGPVLPKLVALALKLWLNLAGLAIAFAVVAWVRRWDWQAVSRWALALAILIGADLLLGISNAQLPAAVLVPVAVPILYELALGSDEGAGGFVSEERPALRLGFRWVLLACGILLGTQRIALELACLGYAFDARAERGATGYRGRQIDAAPFRAVFMPPNRNALSDYPLLVNLGLELVRKHVTEKSKLVAMEYINPFNVALGLKPARGDVWWWVKGKTFSTRTYPAADRVFAEADFVIASRRGADVLWPIYGQYIQQRFELVDRNEEWALFRRAQPR